MLKLAILKKITATKTSTQHSFQTSEDFLKFFEARGVKEVAKKEDVELLIFSELNGQNKSFRKKEHFVSSRFLTLDIDSTTGSEIEAALNKLSEYAYVAYQTFSSTAIEERWRIILPLKEKLTLEEIESQKPVFKLAKMLNVEADPVSNNPVQPFYLPSTPIDETRKLILHEGELFSVESLANVEADDVPVTKTRKSSSAREEKRKELTEESDRVLHNVFDGNLIYCNGNFYIYKHGVWMEETSEFLTQYLYVDMYQKSRSLSEVKVMIEELKICAYVKELPKYDSNKSMIVLDNLVVIPEDKSTHQHSPKFYALHKLPFKYDVNAQCLLWLAFLNFVFENDLDKDKKIMLLQEYMGLSLTNIMKFQSMMWLIGGGSNGKSVVLDVVREMVGKENASAVPMKEFGKRFYLYNTLNKLVNIDADMPIDHYIADDKVKPVVSGDVVQLEKKTHQPFSSTLTVKLWAAANDMPKTKDHSHGLTRRMLVLMFNRKIEVEEQDRHLLDKLREELPGIFNWALEGLERLLENDGFTIPDSSIEMINDYKISTNSVARFFDEHVEVIAPAEQAKSNRVPTFHVYETFKEFCSAYGYSIMNDATFGRRLKTLGVVRVKSNGKNFYHVTLKNLEVFKNPNQFDGDPRVLEDVEEEFDVKENPTPLKKIDIEEAF